MGQRVKQREIPVAPVPEECERTKNEETNQEEVAGRKRWKESRKGGQ